MTPSCVLSFVTHLYIHTFFNTVESHWLGGIYVSGFDILHFWIFDSCRSCPVIDRVLMESPIMKMASQMEKIQVNPITSVNVSIQNIESCTTCRKHFYTLCLLHSDAVCTFATVYCAVTPWCLLIKKIKVLLSC